jgi:hypothetical protein
MGEYKLLKIAQFHGIRKSVFLENIFEAADIGFAVALSGTILLLRVSEGMGPTEAVKTNYKRDLDYGLCTTFGKWEACKLMPVFCLVFVGSL